VAPIVFDDFIIRVRYHEDQLQGFLKETVEFKHLRAFSALAEELHFGRAAARLHIVQPALSAQIRTLEEYLGAQLFERDRHKVSLTDAGKLFLPEALATLHQASHAEQIVRQSSAGEIGVLRVAFVSSVLPELLPEILRTMSVRFPRIEFELKDMSSPDQMNALISHSIDFGLIRVPIPYPGVHARLLFEESLVVALPVGHALCTRASVLAENLVGEQVFVLARKFAPGLYDQVLASIHRKKVSLEIAREMGEFTTMLSLVAAGQGIGILPEKAAYALPPGVVTRPLRVQTAGAGIGVAWTRLESATKRAFAGILDELYPPLAAPARENPAAVTT
jgi:DNA-binding transcriptional LysR family regulator